MYKPTHSVHNQKRIVQVDEFANHLEDLAKRIHGVDIRKVILSK